MSSVKKLSQLPPSQLIQRNLELERQNKEYSVENSRLLDNLEAIKREYAQLRDRNAAQISRLAEKLSIAQDKLNKSNKVELAVADLYMEIMDRHFFDLSYINKAKNKNLDEKRNLVFKNARSDILVLVDQLKSNIRILLTTKEESEEKLKLLLSQNSNSQKEGEKSLRKTIESLQEKCNHYEESHHQIIIQIEDAEKSKTIISDRSTALIKDARLECHEYKVNLDHYKKKLEDIERQLSEKIKECEIKNIEIKKLEDSDSKHRSVKVNSKDTMMSQIQTNNFESEIKKKSAEIGKLIVENNSLTDTVKVLQEQITGFNRNIRINKLNDAIKKEKRSSAKADRLEKQLSESEIGLRKQKFLVDDKTQQIKAMKKEYEKLFSALQKKNQENILQKSSSEAALSYKSLSETDIRRQADENPHVVEYYKKKLRMQAIENSSMKNQFKKLLTNEHKHKIIQKSHENERSKLLNHCQQLRNKLGYSEVLLDELNCTLSEKDKTLEKLKATGSTETSTSYGKDLERLHERNKYLEKLVSFPVEEQHSNNEVLSNQTTHQTTKQDDLVSSTSMLITNKSLGVSMSETQLNQTNVSNKGTTYTRKERPQSAVLSKSSHLKSKDKTEHYFPMKIDTKPTKLTRPKSAYTSKPSKFGSSNSTLVVGSLLNN